MILYSTDLFAKNIPLNPPSKGDFKKFTLRCIDPQAGIDRIKSPFEGGFRGMWI